MRIILAALLTIVAYGSDCDGSFTLKNAGDAVVFNNQTRACYNWQMSYFSSGFSAVSVEFDSAPNGATQGVPGIWTAFAGTVLSGTNPSSATTQSTATFSGSYPWVRARLVSKTGTGSIVGRMLGAQLTSAVQLNSPFVPAPTLGTFIAPQDGDFVWVNQGTATRTVNTNSIDMEIATAMAADQYDKRCASLPVPPWTVTAAYTIFPESGPAQGSIILLQPANAIVSELWRQDASGNISNTWISLDHCTLAQDPARSCNQIAANPQTMIQPVTWQRVRDDGTRRDWEQSFDGVNWGTVGLINAVTGGTYAAITPIQACMGIYQNNGNFPAKLTYYSWKICPNSTGAAC